MSKIDSTANSLPDGRIARSSARAKGWTLNHADRDAVEALESYYAGRMQEHVAMSIVMDAKQASAWRGR